MPGEAWDMRSNIKAKPGSQGTLFQPTKSVLNPAQRWPRGYTPERAAEVRQALPYVQAPEHMEAGKGKYEPGDYRGEFGYKETHVLPVIARSTMPAEHLRGLAEIHGHPDDNTYGTYWPKTKQLAVDMTEKGSDKVLMHELGHHVMYNQERLGAENRLMDTAVNHAEVNYKGEINTSSIHQARSKVNRGVDEALADNYMVEHYRGPGRKGKKATQGEYESEFSPKELHDEYPGYQDIRPTQPRNLGAQFKNYGQGSLLRVTAGNNVRLPDAE